MNVKVLWWLTFYNALQVRLRGPFCKSTINPFPHNDTFWQPLETSLLKTVYSEFAQSHFAQVFPISPIPFSPFPTSPFSHSTQYISCPFAQFHFFAHLSFRPKAISPNFPISPNDHFALFPQGPSHFAQIPFFWYLGPKLIKSSLITKFLNFGPYFQGYYGLNTS